MTSVLRPVKFIPKKNIEKVDKTTGKLVVLFKSNRSYSGCLLPYGVVLSIPHGSDEVFELMEEEILIRTYGRSLDEYV